MRNIETSRSVKQSGVLNLCFIYVTLFFTHSHYWFFIKINTITSSMQLILGERNEL